MTFQKWQRMAGRIARMEPAERRFRVREQLNKRQDGLLYWLRYDFTSHVHRSGRRGRARFFFEPEEVDGRVELLRQRMPGQVEHILQQAEKVLQHRFDLLGYIDLDYGPSIDWHLDAVHSKRAARRIFYRIPYLDFRVVGDSKVTWEVNRHQHFVTLAKAFRLTKDSRYVDEIQREWQHWWKENPYPIGINWASSLEAAFRSLSWLWTCHLLEATPGIKSFREEWLQGLALHGRHIERYLSTYFSPNTHLLGEAVALYFLGILCPELEAAESWKNTGWQIIQEQAQRQVRSDGFHFEQSTYYHVYALDFFLHAAILARVNGLPVPRALQDTVENMLAALCRLGQAGPPRFGDDDGGRVFDSRRNRGDHMLDPLATGAIFFRRGDFKAAATHLREETIWLLGSEGVKVWDELQAQPGEMKSTALSDSGSYLLPAENPAACLAVDCGPLGTQSGGHGHADALSVTLRSEGHALLIDPGTFTYAGESGERDFFRGTAMHNTLRVDGLDQAEPTGPFSWRRLTHAAAEKWIRGRHFDLLVASHDGYQRLAQSITHRRWVFSLQSGLYLVRDRVQGHGNHLLESFWHLGPEMQLVEGTRFRVKGASSELALLPAEEAGWTTELSGGYWSPAYGLKAPAPILTFSARTELPSAFCILLVTLKAAPHSPGIFEPLGCEPADSFVSGYHFRAEGIEHRFYFAEGGRTWRHCGIVSDAEFICWSLERESDRQRLILVNGSNAGIEGGQELRFRRTVSWGEWIQKGNQQEVLSSDMEALADAPATA